MQFDGYPTEKGKNFYEAVLKSLAESKDYFGNEKGPNKKFFLRIQHYLRELQYQSAHSINSRGRTTPDEWKGLDWGSEWKYLFNNEGNFIFFPRHYNGGALWTCTIPWRFTWELASEYRASKYENILDGFWKACEDWTFNKKVPVLSLRVGSSNAFPEQNTQKEPKRGYRDWVKLYFNEKELIASMFARGKPSENYSTKFESEYLTVKNTPLNELPLLINSLELEESKQLLEKRLKGKGELV